MKIRVLRAGLCGTDLHLHDWDQWAAETVRTPMILGHELSGIVTEVGSDVTDVEVGALVSGEGHVVCGRCRSCRAGRRHLCISTQAAHSEADVRRCVDAFVQAREAVSRSGR